MLASNDAVLWKVVTWIPGFRCFGCVSLLSRRLPVFLLSGCAGGAGAYDANLSPAQNQLRQSNARFNQTVGEGAVAGALLGGAAGLGIRWAEPCPGYADRRYGRGRARRRCRLRGGAQQPEPVEHRGAVQRLRFSRRGADAQFYRDSANSSAQIADQAYADAAKTRQRNIAPTRSVRRSYRAGLAGFKTRSMTMLCSIAYPEGHGKPRRRLRQESQVASGSDRTQLANSAAEIEKVDTGNRAESDPAEPGNGGRGMRALLAGGALLGLAACTPQQCDPSQAGFLSGIGCAASGSYATRNQYQTIRACAAERIAASQNRVQAQEEGARASQALVTRDQARRRLGAVDRQTAQLRTRHQRRSNKWRCRPDTIE